MKAKNKVERLRKELADKTDTLNRLLAQHTELVAPHLARVTERQKRLIEVCLLFHSGDGKPPAKTIRKKTKRQQDKEAKEKLAAEARAKNINTVYRQLAHLFHPDLEQDPELKSKKERLMKELTAAYEAGDLHTILGLELRWLQNHDGDISRLSDDKLQAYTAALEEQSTEIQAEICVLAHHPRFTPLRLDMFSIRGSYFMLLGNLRAEASQTHEWAETLESETDNLECHSCSTSRQRTG